MAVAVTLAVSPASPAHGATVTATYTVAGRHSARHTLGAETFTVPTCTGLTFKATAVPNVFTAVVP
jgi:hypothetical protein